MQNGKELQQYSFGFDKVFSPAASQVQLAQLALGTCAMDKGLGVGENCKKNGGILTSLSPVSLNAGCVSHAAGL